jgi:hypothetical protein
MSATSLFVPGLQHDPGWSSWTPDDSWKSHSSGVRFCHGLLSGVNESAKIGDLAGLTSPLECLLDQLDQLDLLEADINDLQ